MGEPTDFWGKPAFKPGQSINDYLEPKLDKSNSYFDTISVVIPDKDYGVLQGEDDFEFIDRKNVVSLSVISHLMSPRPITILQNGLFVGLKKTFFGTTSSSISEH